MEVKDRILSKAADLFTRYGIKSITMDEIASQLGISKKTIYQFFKDKDEMVAAIIEQEIATSEKECMDFRNKAADAVHEIFLALDDMEELLKYLNPLLLYDLEKFHPTSFAKLKEYKNKFIYDMLVGNLTWGIEDGIFRTNFNKDIIARQRIEASFLIFNPEVFPHTRYHIVDVNYELSMFYLYGVVNDKGKQLIEKYNAERNKKSSQ